MMYDGMTQPQQQVVLNKTVITVSLVPVEEVLKDIRMNNPGEAGVKLQES